MSFFPPDFHQLLQLGQVATLDLIFSRLLVAPFLDEPSGKPDGTLQAIPNRNP